MIPVTVVVVCEDVLKMRCIESACTAGYGCGSRNQNVVAPGIVLYAASGVCSSYRQAIIMSLQNCHHGSLRSGSVREFRFVNRRDLLLLNCCGCLHSGFFFFFFCLA